MQINRVLSAVLVISMIIASAGNFGAVNVFAENSDIVHNSEINSDLSAPTGLLINGLESPDNAEDIFFSWVVNDNSYNAVQTAYQIVITDALTTEVAWDSGKVESSEQSYIKYSGGALDSGYPYTWKVRTWDKDGNASDYSEEAEFSTGLADEEWNTEWIKANDLAKNKNAFRHMRKETSLESGKTVAKALAYIACCHDYELHINGTYFGHGQSFDYLDKTDYQGWDITDAVKNNDKLAVGITARWFGGGQGRFAGTPGLLAHIKVYYTDGNVQTIITDGTWKTAVAPFGNQGESVTRRNAEGDFIEIYDARNEFDGWTSIGFDDSTWTDAEVIGEHPVAESFSNVEAEHGHVTEYDKKPVSVTKLADGSFVADFGVVIPARFTVYFESGTAGAELKMEAGYELNSDGSVNTLGGSRQSTDMSYTYIQKDGEQTYRAWDYLGFRYLQIPACGEELTVDDITAKVVHAEIPYGMDTTITTSDDMLNKVYELMKRSSIYSVQNAFVDTPTREKGQFLGDSVNISTATTMTWHERAATRKAILQFLDSSDRYWSEDGETGRFNAVYPNNDGKRDIPEYTIRMPEWVLHYYMQTGDKALLEQAYPYLKKTGDYISRYISNDTGLVTKLDGGYGYGIVDFPESGRFGFDYDGTLEGAKSTVNMISVKSFENIAELAGILGYAEDAADFKDRAAILKENINKMLINDEGLYVDGLDADGNPVSNSAQHSNSYALAYDIVPEDSKEAVAEYAASLGMRQGPMTADVLTEALFDSEKDEAAFKLLTNTEDYGWAKLIKDGYTFTWESWKSNSQSHGWGSASARLIIENIAGVKVVGAGASKVKIAPVYGILDSMSASVATQRGKVDVSYSGEKLDYTLKVTIPANMTAEVELPIMGIGEFIDKNGAEISSTVSDGLQTISIGSGSYEFVFDGVIAADVVIENPENINAHVEIGENSYALPMNETIAENDIANMKIVSDDERYEFAYTSGDIISANMPPKSINGGKINLEAHFKYVAPETETSVLTINGEGKTVVNGTAYDLPYSAELEKGSEAIIDIIPPENKVFVGFEGDNLIGTPAIAVMNGDVEVTAIFADTGDETLLSQGKTATATTSLENSSWGIAKLTDGETTGTGYSSEYTYDSADISDASIYVQLDLGEVIAIDSVVLYPRTDSQAISAGSYMFPQDFTVLVSEDGESFTEAASVVGAKDDGNADKISFDTVNARYVKVEFTKLCSSTALAKRRLQLAEMEVYSGKANITPVSGIILDKTAEITAVGKSVDINTQISSAADNNELVWLVQNEDGTLSHKAEIIADGTSAEILALEKGVVKVVARATDGSGVMAECRIVIEKQIDEIAVNSVSVTENDIIFDAAVSRNGILISAMYDEIGTLVSVNSEIVSAGNEIKKIFAKDGISKGTVKFMLWDSLDKITPVSECAEYTVDAEKTDVVWDLRNAVSEKLTLNTVDFYEYNGITVVGSSSGDYIAPSVGVQYNGQTTVKNGIANRYVKITPEFDGTLEITARTRSGDGSLYAATDIALTDGALIDGLENPTELATGRIEVKAGRDYYLYCVVGGMVIQDIKLSAYEIAE